MDTEEGGYHLIRPDSDPVRIGVRNGIKQADILREGFNDPTLFDDLMEKLGTNKYWEIQDSMVSAEFEIQCARLLPKAIRTEFIMFGPELYQCPYMISDQVASLFGEFNIQRHRLFPAVLEDGGDSWSYWLLYLFTEHDLMVDFARTEFYTGSALMGKTFHQFRSGKERVDFAKDRHGLKLQSLYLSEEGRELDLFRVPGAEIVVSERLKVEMERRGLASGIRILPAFGDVPWPVVFP